KLRTQSGNVHLYFVADNLDLERCYACAGRWTEMRACRQIKAGAVPGARDLRALTLTLGKRRSAMGTGIIDRIHNPFDIEECQRAAIDGHLPGSARRNLVKRSHFRKRHANILKSR